jgi:hypothetical protein
MRGIEMKLLIKEKLRSGKVWYVFEFRINLFYWYLLRDYWWHFTGNIKFRWRRRRPFKNYLGTGILGCFAARDRYLALQELKSMLKKPDVFDALDAIRPVDRETGASRRSEGGDD